MIVAGAFRRIRSRKLEAIAAGFVVSLVMASALTAAALAEAVLRRPIDLPDLDRIHLVIKPGSATPGLANRAVESHTIATLERVQASGACESTEGLVRVDLPIVTTVGGTGSFRPLSFVTAGFWQSVGLSASSGRMFSTEENVPGGPLVAVVSADFERHANVRSLVGASITVASKSVTVVGVLPASFRGLSLGAEADVFFPIGSIGQLVPGQRVTQVAEKQQVPWIRILCKLPYSTIATAVEGLLPSQGGQRLTLLPLRVAAIPERSRQAMTDFVAFLRATHALLLLTVCLAVGALFLIRTESRRRELATCLALGASRSRLIAEVMLEVSLVVGIAVLAAVILAMLALTLVSDLVLPGDVAANRLTIGFKPSLVVFAAVLAVMSIAIVTVVSVRPIVSLGARPWLGAASTPRRLTYQQTIVGVQIAVSLCLCLGLALIGKGVSVAHRLNAGYDIDRLARASWTLDSTVYRPPEARKVFDDIREEVSRNSSVAGIAFNLPGATILNSLDTDIGEVVLPSPVNVERIDSSYFKVAGLAMLEGRAFSVDDGPSSTPVAILSASLARLLYGDRPVVGRLITDGTQRPVSKLQVVGVVSNLVLHVKEPSALTIYTPASQRTLGTFFELRREVVIRAAVDLDSALRDVRAAASKNDKTAMMPAFVSLADSVAAQMAPQRFAATILSVLATVGVSSSLLGTFLVTAAAIKRRQHEFAVRLAVGAGTRDIAAILAKSLGRTIIGGIVAGLILAFLGRRLILSLLFGLTRADLFGVVGVTATLFLVMLVVSFGLALKALRVDPLNLLSQRA